MLKLGTFQSDTARERIGMGRVLTHISLFTGCGGLDLGFALAGIQTRVMIEWNKDCCETLRRNYLGEEGIKKWGPKHKGCYFKLEDYREPAILQRDIREVTSEEILKAGNFQIGECSIVSGGFPCQGFSTARGKRYVDDPRNALYKEFVRVVNDTKPAMIFGENVPGLVSIAKGEIIKQICEDFCNCGYSITWDILNAADYGVPQNRRRVIFIGKRVDALSFPENGNPQLHIAAMPGRITYPEFFLKKHKELSNNIEEKEKEEIRKGFQWYCSINKMGVEMENEIPSRIF